MKGIALILLAIAPLLGLSPANAQELPSFDAAPSCRTVEKTGIGGGRTFASCMQSEMAARDQLKAKWAQFHRDDKEQCLRSCNCGNVNQSYVELLTCIEMASDPALEKNRNRR